MWPFNKKEVVSKEPLVTSVVCVPMFIEDKIEIFSRTDGAYMVVGNIVMDIKNERHYTFEMEGHDNRMYESFRHAGKVTRVSEPFLEDIKRHSSVAYISGETGSLEKARYFVVTVTAILEAVGIGIKVESSGKAFEKDKWLDFSSRLNDADIYEMFVVEGIMMKGGTTFSCGMHNIGYRDTIISNEKFVDALNVIRIFNYYQVIDKPLIYPNQTFQTAVDSPFYRIKEEVSQPYKGDDLFGNPFGMWRLMKE